VRNMERRLELCLLSATDWRARFLAWAVLAIFLATYYELVTNWLRNIRTIKNFSMFTCFS
jgi:hypothetical protein